MSGLLPSLLLMSSGCVLFTDPINVGPTVSIIGPDTYERNESPAFTADAKDDEPRTLLYAWGVVTGTCPENGTLPPGTPFRQSLAQSFRFDVPDIGPFCVFVTVT